MNFYVWNFSFFNDIPWAFMRKSSFKSGAAFYDLFLWIIICILGCAGSPYYLPSKLLSALIIGFYLDFNNCLNYLKQYFITSWKGATLYTTSSLNGYWCSIIFICAKIWSNEKRKITFCRLMSIHDMSKSYQPHGERQMSLI